MKIPITKDSYIFSDLQMTAGLVPRFSKNTIDQCSMQRYGRSVVFEVIGEQLAAAGYSASDFVDYGFEIEEEPLADSIDALGLRPGDDVTVFINDEHGSRSQECKIHETFGTGFSINHESFFFGGLVRFYFKKGRFFSRAFLKLAEQNEKMPDVWQWELIDDEEYALPNCMLKKD